MAQELPKLPYPYDALEPHIDARTLEIHHSKHHAGYVTNLNKILDANPDLAAMDLKKLISHPEKAPEAVRPGVIFHGGGTWNHTLYWNSMSPDGGGEPSGPLATALDRDFGGFDEFRKAFAAKAAGQFGSGWGWLSADKKGKLIVTSTLNHEVPMTDGLEPILVVDVWEHAYYLKYQNLRPTYLESWWNLVDWKEVEKRFAAIAV
ncbi:MAG: superoxide dismutase [Candidatus Eisenbacteria bacterium]|nr:superoxide dismutase [Candidatus Eisenbacteria bacterium]